MISSVPQRTEFLEHCLPLQEEGLILKNPESAWKPDDRRLGSWVKLKPEYARSYEVSMLQLAQQGTILLKRADRTSRRLVTACTCQQTRAATDSGQA